MSIADPALWGFASMFAWGVTDMMARYAAVHLGSAMVALTVQGMGVVPPLLLGISRYPPLDYLAAGDFIVLTFFCGFLFTSGYVVYYQGLLKGQVFIVSPLTSSWLVVTTILGVIFLDEVVGPVNALLIGVVLLGIILTSASGRDGTTASGYWYGITGMIAFGIAFTLWKPLVEDVGPYVTVASVRFISAILLGSYLTATGAMRVSWSRHATLLVASAAVVDSLGYVTFNLGIERAPISLIAPVAASYPAVTLVLAWVLVKERVRPLQMGGIVTVLGGVVALSAVG
ncbi:MAG: DMT family transporter [Chloroflexi bacterium]|nr:DMT family transporter [Chloroflexota bacterium]